MHLDQIAALSHGLLCGRVRRAALQRTHREFHLGLQLGGVHVTGSVLSAFEKIWCRLPLAFVYITA